MRLDCCRLALFARVSDFAPPLPRAPAFAFCLRPRLRSRARHSGQGFVFMLQTRHAGVLDAAGVPAAGRRNIVLCNALRGCAIAAVTLVRSSRCLITTAVLLLFCALLLPPLLPPPLPPPLRGSERPGSPGTFPRAQRLQQWRVRVEYFR